jgi:hypothetical protein
MLYAEQKYFTDEQQAQFVRDVALIEAVAAGGRNILLDGVPESDIIKALCRMACVQRIAFRRRFEESETNAAA